jgi:pimeloyl-ACP methyl ester carboxylesterase
MSQTEKFLLNQYLCATTIRRRFVTQSVRIAGVLKRCCLVFDVFLTANAVILLVAVSALQPFVQAGTESRTPTSSSAAMSHDTARVNGVNYHYVLSGSGPAVVLLHGWPVTWRYWTPIIPKLADHYTVVAPDLRGLGLTEKTESGYDKRTVAEDIYSLIRHLGHERVYVVGHDIGGMVAFALAHEHPESVHKLVILDAPLPGLGIWEQSLRRLWHLGFHQVPGLPEALVTGKVEIYLRYFFTFNVYDRNSIADDEIKEYVGAYSQPGALRAGFAYYRAISQDVEANQRYARTKLKMPVLALGGALTTGEGTLRQLQPVAENVRGGVIERSGHWLATEQPDELANRLLVFFAEP